MEYQAINWMRLLEPEVLVFMIPIVAIFCGSIISIIKRSHKHRERMTMIAAGMHPDFPPDEEPTEDGDIPLKQTTDSRDA